MKYSIDTNSTKKAYIQIYEQLRRDIINCLYKYGEKLPSKQHKLVLAWIEIHKEELIANWKLAQYGEAMFKIDPLK